MLSLPEMWEAGDPLVGVGRGVAASTSSAGGVVVRHLPAVSETVWTGNIIIDHYNKLYVMSFTWLLIL